MFAEPSGMQKGLALGLMVFVGCSSSGAKPRSDAGTGAPDAAPTVVVSGGTPVQVVPPSPSAAEVALRSTLQSLEGLTADDLQAKHPADFQQLGYSPSAAHGLDLLQGSMLKLNTDELERLDERGFVIVDRQRFPHFSYAYDAIYAADLPVFVSADSVLHAVHRSYDEILEALETAALLPELTALLEGMRATLGSGGAADLGADARSDADLFLAVAASLLRDTGTVAPVAGANQRAIDDLVAKARGAGPPSAVTLFGTRRVYDWSQFKPRGHYTDSEELKRYFRAMIWLGRTDFSLVFTDPDTQELRFVRPALAAAFALRSLMDEAARAHYERIDAVVRAFVGEPDSMGPTRVDDYLQALGVTTAAAALALEDQRLAQVLVEGRFGQQQIASQIVMAGPHAGTLPLDRVFLFFGQRYVLDSHVLSNVVYDRWNAPPPVPKRMVPNSLDVAYAALGNDHAAVLLKDELSTYRYAPALEQVRALADQHDATFWNANLYNIWLSALRGLSPAVAQAPGTGTLPGVAATEGWARRLLSTQLASWAELRHDTILYAKPSYTGGVACEFPDAYVDPYPEVFARLELMGQRGAELAAQLPTSKSTGSVRQYFTKLADVAGILRGMAEAQRAGTPHTAAQLAFINRMVKIQSVCGGASVDGWYTDLFFGYESRHKTKFTIADVHTTPTDESGAPVGWVLHVGTSYPRLMVTTIDTCAGPRLYVGAVSTFHEFKTVGYERLDDPTWEGKVTKGEVSEVPWTRPVVVKALN